MTTGINFFGTVSGNPRVHLIAASSSVFWNDVCFADGGVPASWSIAVGDTAFVGAVLGNWKLCSAREPTDADRQLMRVAACRLVKGGIRCNGFVEYHATETFAFSIPIPCNSDVDLSEFPRQSRAEQGLHTIIDSVSTPRLYDWGTVMGQWPDSVASELLAVKLSPQFAARVLIAGWRYFHTVCITAKTNRARFLGDQPSRFRVASFRARDKKASAAHETPAAACDNRGTGTVDTARTHANCHLIIDWLRASRFLRNQKLHKEAAAAWARLFRNHEAGVDEDLAEGVPIISHESLRRARIRLDILCMLLKRREFREMLQGNESKHRGPHFSYMWTLRPSGGAWSFSPHLATRCLEINGLVSFGQRFA